MEFFSSLDQFMEANPPSAALTLFFSLYKKTKSIEYFVIASISVIVLIYLVPVLRKALYWNSCLKNGKLV